MTDPAIQHPPCALVPPERAEAYVALGWTIRDEHGSDGYGNPRVYLRWERDDEPVLPKGEGK